MKEEKFARNKETLTDEVSGDLGISEGSRLQGFVLKGPGLNAVNIL